MLRWRDWRTLVEHEIEFTVDSVDATLRLIELLDKSDLLVTNELFPDAAVPQVVWADDDGAFPWEEDYSLAVRDQFVKASRVRHTAPALGTSPARRAPTARSGARRSGEQPAGGPRRSGRLQSFPLNGKVC